MGNVTAKQAQDMIETSLGVKFIITGLARLVEEEGHTAHEALEIARYTGNNCFHVLLELQKSTAK